MAEGIESTNPLGKELTHMSVNNPDHDFVPPLGGTTTVYYRTVLDGPDDSPDDDLHGGRLDVILCEAVDIEGVQPLHTSVHGERTFRTPTELDELIDSLQELRAEWVHLTIPPRSVEQALTNLDAATDARIRELGLVPEEWDGIDTEGRAYRDTLVHQDGPIIVTRVETSDGSTELAVMVDDTAPDPGCEAEDLLKLARSATNAAAAIEAGDSK